MQPQDQNKQPKSSSSAAPGGYISAVEAAARFNLTNDHIASLARKGKVAGTLTGRTWYVDVESLESYIQGVNAQKENRKSELSARLKQEYQERAPAPAPAPKPIEHTPTMPEWKPVISPIQFEHTPFAKRHSHAPLVAAMALFFFAGAILSPLAQVPQHMASIGSETLSAAADVASSAPRPDLTLPDKNLFIESLGENGLAIWDKTFGAAGDAIVTFSQKSITSSLGAVADLYTATPEQPSEEKTPAQTDTVFRTENIKIIAQQTQLDTSALAQAGWQLAAVGNMLADGAAQAPAGPTPEAATPAVRAYVAQAKSASSARLGALQNNEAGTIGSFAVSLVLLPDQFLTDMVDSFIDEAIATDQGIAYSLDVLSDVQNNFYSQYVAAVYATGDTYTDFLTGFSTAFVQDVEPIGDTAAALYGAVGNVFVASVDQVGDAQANAYSTYGQALKGNSDVVNLSAATVQTLPDTYASLIGGIGGEFVATIDEVPNTYAGLVGGIGTAFVAGTDNTANAYAAGVGSFAGAFLQGTDMAADVYAATVGSLSQGLLDWANALADSQAEIYGTLATTGPHAWAATFGGFGEIFVASVDQVGDAQANAYATLAGTASRVMAAGSNNFSTAAVERAVDTQAGWGMVWGGWTDWLAQKLYGVHPQETI